jgi:hypothetical protein
LLTDTFSLLPHPRSFGSVFIGSLFTWPHHG